MDNNEIKVATKVDPKQRLRKVMFPMGLATSIIFFIWMILHVIGVSLENVTIVENMLDASRYIAMAGIFLSFAVCALMIAHTVLQFVKMKNDNVKNEITPAIINALVGLLMFIFFIILAVKVFNEEKWNYYEPLLSNGYKYGSDTFAIFGMMGIMFTLLVFCSIFAFQVDKNKRLANNSNDRMIRTIGITAFVLCLIAMLPIAYGFATGLKNAGNLYDKDHEAFLKFYSKWLAGGMAIKFAYGMIGSIALSMLMLIPLSLMNEQTKDGKVKHVVLWSILGFVAIVLFAIAASMMKVNKESGYAVLSTSKWYLKTVTCSIFALITLAVGIICGSVAFVKSNKLLAPKPTPTAQAIQA